MYESITLDLLLGFNANAGGMKEVLEKVWF